MAGKTADKARNPKTLDLGTLTFFVSKPWILAAGIWLAWFWLAFVAGLCFPKTSGGWPVLGAPLALASAAGVLVFGAVSWQKLFVLVQKPVSLYIAGGMAAALSWLLSASDTMQLPTWVAWICCLLVGACAAIILLVSVVGYARLNYRQGFVAIHISLLATFFAYFVVMSFPGAVQGIIFALLPVIAVLSARTETRDQSPSLWLLARQQETAEHDRTFTYIVVEAALLFMTIGYARSYTLSAGAGYQLLSLGSSPAITFLTILATAMIIAECYSVFSTSTIKFYYILVNLGIPFSIVALALGNAFSSPVRILENTSYLVLFVVLLCVLSAAIAEHRNQPLKAISTMFAACAIGAALGWGLRELIGLFYPEANASITFLVAFSFLDFAYFMFGFAPAMLQTYVSGQDEAAEPSKADDQQKPDRMSFREAVTRVGADAGLSAREQEVFFLLAKGESSQKIADMLVISYHTVRAHTRNIYSKLGVHDHQELRDKIYAEIDKSISQDIASRAPEGPQPSKRSK